MNNDGQKRLFFGIEVDAPWPDKLPFGRIIEEKDRHVTLAFLGNTDFSKLNKILSEFPQPDFKVGFVGKFDQCLFFPSRHPRVISWHPQIVEKEDFLFRFQQKLTEWLKQNGFASDQKHPFTPHVTLARAPFNLQKWETSFVPLPFMLKEIHLYESLGHSRFSTLWTYPILAPIEPISHTADLAFWIRGESFDALYLHGAFALSFTFPEILNYLSLKTKCTSLDKVIQALNELIFLADKEIGCPFKAVSFHTNMKENEKIMEWEMIIDV